MLKIQPVISGPNLPQHQRDLKMVEAVGINKFILFERDTAIKSGKKFLSEVKEYRDIYHALLHNGFVLELFRIKITS